MAQKRFRSKPRLVAYIFAIRRAIPRQHANDPCAHRIAHNPHHRQITFIVVVAADLRAKPLLQRNRDVIEQCMGVFCIGIIVYILAATQTPNQSKFPKLSKILARARLLESIVHPHIRLLLKERLAALEEEGFSSVVVVEVPLLDRVEDLIAEVDEVLVVTCPVGVRRVRAIGRGMDGRDFDARVGKQPTDAWLVARADTVFDNRGTRQELIDEVDAWFYARTAQLGGASAPEGI